MISKTYDKTFNIMKFYECRIPAVVYEIYRWVHIDSMSVLCAGELGDAM